MNDDKSPTVQAPRAAIGRPRFTPPEGACDCHAHVFDGRSALSPGRLYTPADAPLEAYEAMLDALGIARGVIVQPSVYGTDNRSTLAALDAGNGRFRAVLVVEPGTSDETLKGYHERGVRGLRTNAVFGGGPRDLMRLCEKIAPLGWHLQMLADVSQAAELSDLLASLPVPLVFDHMGHLPGSRGVDDPGFQRLLRAVGDGRAWVKLSGPYRMSTEDRPPYSDVHAFATALVAANPERCVFGTDWPHPHIAGTMPDDAALLDLFADWVPDDATRQRILVSNPAKLYGFDRPVSTA